MKSSLFLALPLLLGGCTINEPISAAQRIDEMRAARQHAFPVTPRIEAARAQLILEYRDFISRLLPDYNGISVEFNPNAYGPEWGSLRASHLLLQHFTTSFGPVGPAIQRWVEDHIDLLTEARVTRVGIGNLLNGYCDTGVQPPQ